MYVSVVANLKIQLLQIKTMLKIAILVRRETTDKCTGKGCLRAFFSKTESFARYQEIEIELVGFFHSGGDLDYKLNKMKEAGVQVIHVSTCMRGKYNGYEKLVKKIARDFDVIGYTHGSENGKTRRTATITGKII
jgi:predicted metal-binding protein